MEDFFDDAAALGDRRQIRSYCFQEAVMVEKVGLVVGQWCLAVAWRA